MENNLLRIGRECIYLVLIISAPPVLAGLAAGLLVGILQAATQIQEQTVTFVPKIIAVFVMLLLCGRWMFSLLLTFTHKLLYNLPNLLSL
ncbi:MAG: EscS/YscS/HrcS family type III secretion system export apparatus protein [Candidatus Fischerbacteria bacterium RBG_13_37_8]|uniref:Flagellar biosynthetic protein FliQ n=1 Tax=Candidatus Fischerbacteria bacterium RBG_13_37_8 TaxID=1817863 RepID=A0A1F5VQU5_9BACT|nr:MAG: EscS/YscS/HrcS family type III secretion system export apparatus protein [Candidatus Fischerbacteria bacterium RBG_13_37_8]